MLKALKLSLALFCMVISLWPEAKKASKADLAVCKKAIALIEKSDFYRTLSKNPPENPKIFQETFIRVRLSEYPTPHIPCQVSYGYDGPVSEIDLYVGTGILYYDGPGLGPSCSKKGFLHCSSTNRDKKYCSSKTVKQLQKLVGIDPENRKGCPYPPE